MTQLRQSAVEQQDFETASFLRSMEDLLRADAVPGEPPPEVTDLDVVRHLMQRLRFAEGRIKLQNDLRTIVRTMPGRQGDGSTGNDFTDDDIAETIDAATFVLNCEVDSIQAVHSIDDETREDREATGMQYVEAVRTVALAVKELFVLSPRPLPLSRPMNSCEANAMRRFATERMQLEAKAITCCFCNEQCESLDKLKEHSAHCKSHPMTKLFIKHEHDLCQMVAKALGGFPRYKDDQVNFPDATVADGVCVADHTIETLLATLIEQHAYYRATTAVIRASLEQPPTVPLAKLAFGALCEIVCRDLPEGWSVMIELESGAGSVTMQNQDGEEFPLDDHSVFELDMQEQVTTCINLAREADGMPPVEFAVTTLPAAPAATHATCDSRVFNKVKIPLGGNDNVLCETVEIHRNTDDRGKVNTVVKFHGVVGLTAAIHKLIGMLSELPGISELHMGSLVSEAIPTLRDVLATSTTPVIGAVEDEMRLIQTITAMSSTQLNPDFSCMVD